MDIENIILEAMKKTGKPMSAGQIAETTGQDRKAIDKGMKGLKTSGKIESPKMCYWQPANK